MPGGADLVVSSLILSPYRLEYLLREDRGSRRSPVLCHSRLHFSWLSDWRLHRWFVLSMFWEREESTLNRFPVAYVKLK